MTDTDLTALAPCPFCTSAGAPCIYEEVGPDNDVAYVGCDACLAKGPEEGSVAAAVEAWNSAARLAAQKPGRSEEAVRAALFLIDREIRRLNDSIAECRRNGQSRYVENLTSQKSVWEDCRARVALPPSPDAATDRSEVERCAVVARVIKDHAKKQFADPETDDMTVSLAIEFGEKLTVAEAAIAQMREALKGAQRIIERDFPNGQLAIDIRAALSSAPAPAPVAGFSGYGEYTPITVRGSTAPAQEPAGQSEAKPVAWQTEWKPGHWITLPTDWTAAEAVTGQNYRPLYATHPTGKVSGEPAGQSEAKPDAPGVDREKLRERLISELSKEFMFTAESRRKADRAVGLALRFLPTVKVSGDAPTRPADWLTIPAEGFQKFVDALDNPKPPTEALVKLMREPSPWPTRSAEMSAEEMRLRCARLCDTQSPTTPDREDHSAEYRDGYSDGADAAAAYFSSAIRALPTSSIAEVRK